MSIATAAEQWITFEQAKQRMRCSRQTLIRAIEDGRLSERRTISGRRYLRLAELDAILDAGTRAASGTV
jgi:excisionase family DNA binding protein